MFGELGDCRQCSWYNWDGDMLCHNPDSDQGEHMEPEDGCNRCDFDA